MAAAGAAGLGRESSFCALGVVQVVRHDDLLRLAQQQQQKMVEIPALRGSIFDRDGQPLAKSLPAESICVNPQRIPDAGVAADLLSRLLDMDRAKLFDRIGNAKLRGAGFLWIKRKVDSSEAERVRNQKLEWVDFRPRCGVFTRAASWLPTWWDRRASWTTR